MNSKTQTVPAGQVACFGCDGASDSSRQFCSHCGAALWDKCEKCDAPYSAGEAFCGGCGLNLADHFANRRSEVESLWTSLHKAQAECRYGDAIYAARSLASLDHVRFTQDAAKAKPLVAALEAERTAKVAEAKAIVEKAEKAYEQRGYETAYVLLDPIPKPLRTPEAIQLFRAAYAKHKEVLTLAGGIREGLGKGDFLELLAMIERLLHLQPEHPQAEKLGEKVAYNLFLQAKQQFAAQQYEEAVASLQALPSRFSKDKYQALLETAQEHAWLWGDIQAATLLTPTVEALVDRFAKLAPEHPKAKALKTQITKVRQTKPKALIALKAPPAEPAVGFPVERVAAKLQGFEIDENLKQDLHAPQELFVACGLALQQLKKTAIHAQLAPPIKKKSFLTMKIGRGPKLSHAWGIDIGRSSVRAVRFTEGKEQPPLLDRVLRFELPFGKRFNNEDREQSELVGLAVDKLIEQEEMKKDSIAISMPGPHLLCRFSELPPVDYKSLEKVIQTEVVTQIPFPIKELYWGYQFLSPSDGETSPDEDDEDATKRVMLIAAKATLIDPTLRLFEERDLSVETVQSDSLALYNYLEFAAGNAKQRTVNAYLDIGAAWTNLIVMGPEHRWFRSLHFGGDKLTRDLAGRFQLTHGQAEQAKRAPAKARSLHQMYSALAPAFHNLLEELKLSFLAYSKAHPDRPINRLHCLGGAFQTHGMVRSLLYGNVGGSSVLKASGDLDKNR